ncbi:MAG: NAD-binding protein [Firmicutes bacterium]|nr:NAD-binding protein [Bacillota bacterium]
MNAIIVGCGRTGSLLAQTLEDEGHEVTVIDRSADSFVRLNGFKGNRIMGNGADVEILKQAGIESTDLFASVTEKDNTNLMSAQIAKGIFGVKRVACRVYDARLATIYADLGLDTVSITTIGARMLGNILLGSRIIKRFQLGDGSGVALEIKLGDNMDGKPVSTLNIPGEFKPAAIMRGLKVIIPDDSFIIKTDDHIFGVAMTNKIKTLETLVCPAKCGESTSCLNAEIKGDL